MGLILLKNWKLSYTDTFPFGSRFKNAYRGFWFANFWNCVICLEDLRVSCAPWDLPLLYFFKNVQLAFFFSETKSFLYLNILDHAQWKWSLQWIEGVYLYYLATITLVWKWSSTWFKHIFEGWKNMIIPVDTTEFPSNHCFWIFPLYFLHTMFPQFPVNWKTFLSWELMTSQSIKSQWWQRCLSSDLYQWDTRPRTDRLWGGTSQIQSILPLHVM